MSRIVSVVLALAAVSFAQSDRVAMAVDGDPSEGVVVEGRSERVVDASRVKHGKAALKVSPDESSRFYGATFRSVAVAGAAEIVCVVFVEGAKDVDFRVRVDDDAGGRSQDGASIEYKPLKPGWNEIVLGLSDRTAGDGRKLDLSKTVASIQISRRRDDGAPAIFFDAVLLRGAKTTVAPSGDAPPRTPDPSSSDEPTADQRAAEKKLRFACASEKDGSKRARLVREGIDVLGETLRVEFAVRLLKEDEAPRVRRAAREALSRTTTEHGLAAILAALDGLSPQSRVEAVWALGASTAPNLRAAAVARGSLETTPAPERTSILTGLARRGNADAAALLPYCPAEGPWPQRAALVRALRDGENAACVEPLIEILSAPGCERVADDAEDALVALTGNDLGRNAAAWREWWSVARDKTTTFGKGARKTAYGTFYGLSVPKGRVAFVIDVSGSMREPIAGDRVADHIKGAKHLDPAEIKSRLDLAKAELKFAIENMPEAASVGVISFSDERTYLTDGVERAVGPLKDRLVRRVKNLAAAGRTNVYAGLHAAYFPSKTPSDKDYLEGPDTIILLSDGNPSAGKYSQREELRDEVLAWNLGRAIKIHCVNVGDADVQMLRSWTQGTGGTLLDLRSTRPPPKR